MVKCKYVGIRKQVVYLVFKIQHRVRACKEYLASARTSLYLSEESWGQWVFSQLFILPIPGG